MGWGWETRALRKPDTAELFLSQSCRVHRFQPKPANRRRPSNPRELKNSFFSYPTSLLHPTPDPHPHPYPWLTQRSLEAPRSTFSYSVR